MLFILLVYSYIIDINDTSMFIWYFTLFCIGSFILQAIGQTIAIIFHSNKRIVVFFSICIILLSVFLGNFIVKTKELHYTIQYLCSYNPIKLIFECLLLLIYGFDRCNDREFSFPLSLFNIDSNDYYLNFRILILLLIICRSIPILAIYFRVNSNKKINKFEKIKKNSTHLYNENFLIQINNLSQAWPKGSQPKTHLSS